MSFVTIFIPQLEIEFEEPVERDDRFVYDHTAYPDVDEYKVKDTIFEDIIKGVHLQYGTVIFFKKVEGYENQFKKLYRL
jgi:hypothetical protein